MIFYIYALRLKGGVEARYIGLTSKSVAHRLAGHFSVAQSMPRKSTFAWWLLENRQNVEAVPLAKVDTTVFKEAQAYERTFIALVLQLGHGLFNRKHVPADRLLPAYREAEAKWFAEWEADGVAA